MRYSIGNLPIWNVGAFWDTYPIRTFIQRCEVVFHDLSYPRPPGCRPHATLGCTTTFTLLHRPSPLSILHLHSKLTQNWWYPWICKLKGTFPQFWLDRIVPHSWQKISRSPTIRQGLPTASWCLCRAGDSKCRPHQLENNRGPTTPSKSPGFGRLPGSPAPPKGWVETLQITGRTTYHLAQNFATSHKKTLPDFRLIALCPAGGYWLGMGNIISWFNCLSFTVAPKEKQNSPSANQTWLAGKSPIYS